MYAGDGRRWRRLGTGDEHWETTGDEQRLGARVAGTRTTGDEQRLGARVAGTRTAMLVGNSVAHG